LFLLICLNLLIDLIPNNIGMIAAWKWAINKIEVLLDDRDDRAGVKFKDAELIGIPFHIIIGRDSINKEVELICRTNNTKFKVTVDKLFETFISESEIMYNKNPKG